MPSLTGTLVLGGAGLIVAAVSLHADRQWRLGILRAIGERRHGRLTNGLFGRPTLALVLPDGIELTISMWSTRWGTNTQGKNTEYIATLPTPGVPNCLVRPGAVPWFDRKRGVQDIEIGAPAFDDAFIVQGQDEALVRRLWTSERALRVTPGSRIECGGTQIKLLESVIARDEQVDRAIELLLDLARCDPYGERVLGELPEAALVRDAAGLQQAEVPGPSRITVGPVRRDGRTRTRATIAVAATVDDTARAKVASLGGALEAGADEMAIVWPSIEDSRERLVAAIEILRQLASGTSLGAFR